MLTAYEQSGDLQGSFCEMTVFVDGFCPQGPKLQNPPSPRECELIESLLHGIFDFLNGYSRCSWHRGINRYKLRILDVRGRGEVMRAQADQVELSEIE